MNIKVKLKDNVTREFKKGSSLIEIAKQIKPSYSKEALIATVDGVEKDMNTILDKDCELSIETFNTDRGRHTFWHSSAHLLAQAICRLWKGAKLGTGPALENGFYYDIDLDHIITEQDFELIEKEAAKIVSESLAIERIEPTKEEVLEILRKANQTYKLELIEKWGDSAELSMYKQGEFIDLCTGPHVPNTSYIKAFKVLSVSGAYWQKNDKNKMLQRIYGISFDKKKSLEEYLYKIEQAKLRDHRKLGRELGIFASREEGPGFMFFLPNGVKLKNELTSMWREKHKDYNYLEIETPSILSRKLWETSGHWDHYQENMYTLKIDDEDYAIKPMNCPGAILTYKNDVHSYRELPIRLAELGKVHRHEISGALHGLMRVRAFTQDDAHIFILPDQIQSEVENIIKLVDDVYKLFGFTYSLVLSTRPENFLGTVEEWDRAEKSLANAMESLGIPYTVNEGDGAFYGPKIDFILHDSLGRNWQCATVQLDYQNSQSFDLHYIGSDGEKHRPLILHRVVFGSFERFIGILIEHFAGKFPVWLSPEQVRILLVSEAFLDYGKEVEKRLRKENIRVSLDKRSEKIGYKIREAQLQKIPYMIIIGEKEASSNQVTIRTRSKDQNGKNDLGMMSLDDFVSRIQKEIKDRSYNKEELV